MFERKRQDAEGTLVRAVESAWRRALAYYGLREPLPAVDFSLKGQAAGQACWQRTVGRISRRPGKPGRLKIRLNLDAYHLDPQDMISDTIPHEVSHLVVVLLCPDGRPRPHGRQWQAVMRDCFGIARPRRTHALALKKARTLKRNYLYVCRCARQHRLTGIRHNRIGRGTVYRCRTCGQALQFLGVADE
jgi:SprT protein